MSCGETPLALRDLSNELGPVATAPDPASRLVPARECLALRGTEGQRLRALWSTLPDHPLLFAPLRSPEGHLMLRYAALARNVPRTESVPMLAELGARLAEVYHVIASVVPETELGHFGDPFFRFDEASQLRVGFRPVAAWPFRLGPETEKTWPHCDQRALVHLVGELVSDRIFQLCDTGLSRVLDRGRASKPAKRYQSLDELRAAFTTAGKVAPVMKPEDLVGWRQIEEGLGWLELYEPERARDRLELMLDGGPYASIARRGHERACLACDKLAIEELARSEAAVSGSRASVPASPHPRVSQTASTEASPVVKRPAPVVRVITPAERARSLHARGAFREALVEIETALASTPADPGHHYTHGKILLRLGRLDDARAAFDTACALDPRMLEAMLLRREVDRAIGIGRRRIGTQGPMASELPASLVELRDVLTSGRTSDAIAALSDPRFRDDADAQLVLARLLVVDGQPQRALELFDRVVSEPHRHDALLGKATVLLDLGDHDAALTVFDQLCADKPDDADASEGRARTLERLGRTDDAAIEFRRFISLATRGSDVRVRAARRWLAEHA